MPSVVVYGAYGHTGRFIVAELVRRGWAPVLSGRDENQLKQLAAGYPELPVIAAAVDDPDALDSALQGHDAVINSAGPFAKTAHPLVEAALRAGMHYLDVAAEVEVAAEVVARYHDRAMAEGVVIAPSIGFYGGLGDLLATAALGSSDPKAEKITLAYALDSWVPTLGTRATVAVSKDRRGGQRLVYDNGVLGLRNDAAPITEWTYPDPIGTQTVVGEFTTADSVTIPRHLNTAALHTYMTAAPLSDLSSPDLTPPRPADGTGRSAQHFLVEVVAYTDTTTHRAIAAGRDIYASTAPLITEALTRIFAGTPPGVRTAGQISDARTLLQSLHPDHLERLEFSA